MPATWSASPTTARCRIGDTLTEGEDILFRGVPNFAPEILRRVRLGDAMKAKKLKEALQQMAEEGVVQLFSPEDGSPAIVGVVGALQLDVLKERLSAEYTLPVDFEMARFSVCRWITADSPAELSRFIEAHRGDIARDLDGDPVFLAPHEFGLNYEAERWKAGPLRRGEGLSGAGGGLRRWRRHSTAKERELLRFAKRSVALSTRATLPPISWEPPLGQDRPEGHRRTDRLDGRRRAAERQFL